MEDPRREKPLTGDELREWAEREADRRFMEAPPDGWTHADRIATHPSDRWATPERPETKVEIRSRLKEVRIRKMLTQAELAKLSGVAVSTISHFESGLTQRTRSDTWLALAQALKVDPMELVDVIERPLTAEEAREKAERIARRREKEAARQRARREKEREERRRAGAANDADPQSEAPERPLPGDRTDEG